MTFRKEIIGDCTLYLGDCLDVVPTLEKPDVVVTDPPYSQDTQSGGRTRNDLEFSGDAFIPFSIQWSDLKLRLDLCRPHRWLIASVDWRHGIEMETNPPSGTRFIRAGVWVKPNSAPQFTGDRPAHGWEFIACCHGEAKMYWNGKGKRGVWTHAVASQNGHPTPKPESLMQEFVTDFSQGGETVLDPFMGSGTTGVACVKTGRKFIGIELEERYFDIACRRIQDAVDRPDMFVEAAKKAEQLTLLEATP